MNEIAKVKKEVKLSKWAEMVRKRNESGLTVTDWCKENGINLKTYYYGPPWQDHLASGHSNQKSPKHTAFRLLP